jgi:hypothetical protein
MESSSGSRWPSKLTMSDPEAAELVERYIDFVDNTGRSVHYMRRDDGALPTVAAISTLPLNEHRRAVWAPGKGFSPGEVWGRAPG